MVALSILGLNWCQHAGWKIVLREAGRGRRLQVTLSPEEAVVVGHELAQHSSERSGLYLLIGALLREQPHLASINLALTESNRARTALVVRADESETAYPTSAADGIALAVRARLQRGVKQRARTRHQYRASAVRAIRVYVFPFEDPSR